LSHKKHEIAKRQQTGFGDIISFSLKDDDAYSAIKFTKATKLFQLVESLGRAKSLLWHPATMTHKSTPDDIRRKACVQDSLIRLSCGLEDAEDLVNDIDQALYFLKKNKFAVTFAE
jgi:cystathionine beta-lyase/cystathionine gamma-synthase